MCNDLSDIITKIYPIKISCARRLKMGAYGWGIVTEFYLESVKINSYNGNLRSAAVFKVNDKAGRVTLLAEGSNIAVLFGLTNEQWKQIEQMAATTSELFYRRFKLGLSDNFPVEQQIFYYFCQTNQTSEPFLVTFQRVPNNRKNEKTIAFLKIVDAKPHTPALLRNYFSKCEEIKEMETKKT